MWKKVLLAVLLSTSLFSTSVFAAPSENDHFKNRYKHVQLLGINDFHGQLDVYRDIAGRQAGGAEYLAAYLKKYEQETKNTLLVHAGDVVGASSPVSSLLQDEPTIEILNELGFDVGTVGNHEFDEGVDEMKRLIYGGEHEETGEFEGASFPYTVANVVDEDTGETILPPYVIKKVNGIPIGFIGVVTTETRNIVLPSGIEGVEFTDETNAINDAAQQLKEQGVKSIVVLAHVPASSEQDGTNPSGDVVEFAPHIDDEVDVILGGHNHDYANTVVDDKLIVQSYSSGTAFSDIDLMIDPKTKDIVSKEAAIVTTYHDRIEPDEQIADMVDTYKKDIEDLVEEVVAETSEAITTGQDESGESALGNLVADSQRATMGSDFAFMNPGGIRADLDEGPVTWGELYTMLPFGNNLVNMTLTGNQIKAVLEQQWEDNSSTILQVSGLQYTWEDDAPIGERIVEMTDNEGNPIEPSQAYTVTVNNFLAEGGDGFTVLTEGTNQVTGPLALDAMIAYLQEQEGPIAAPEDGRIEIK
ncbi:bifunctional metallophosphatase/5'-nucleotidase [Sediminibacillus dalangtanensis]|uniref:Bifunctional metallophosphatase/5'-nucleotidase n=1 Tax=Sediminibacillus dalangtanensis TaxID=2729421 RepID=A0ABX7VUX4_9BACI|nr:5'-nucleotidase C-terminal domain-containing protein [Sediminibacillus dalangtanensis]QTN00763.1 bifunctional metallophosphatase/5'-nucleotidase [Sediminibacillus dalangtanensis]